jgi:hypothetical protein
VSPRQREFPSAARVRFQGRVLLLLCMCGQKLDSPKIASRSQGLLLDAHKAPTRPQDIHLPYMEEVHMYNYIDIWMHQHEYNYSSFGHGLYVNFAVRRDYSSLAARALRRPRRAPRLLVSGRTRSTSTSPCAATTRLRPHALYVDLVVHRGYLPPVAATSPQLRRASGCLGTSRGPSRGSSSTTPCTATSSCGHTGSTSAMLCIATTCLAATLALLRVRRTPPRRRLPVASR